MNPMNSVANFNVVSSVRPKRWLIILATVIAATVGARAAHAAATGYLLTLTENSSTSLSLAYTGTGGASSFSVTPNGLDNWTVTVNPNNYPSIFFSEFTADFMELENPNEVNEAYSGDMTIIHSSFTVESDVPLATYQGNLTTLYPNGGITSTPIGFDGPTAIFLQFIDNAAIPENSSGVPEGGSTLLLLGLSAAGIACLNRFRRLQLG
jgi:hypothetical protein